MKSNRKPLATTLRPCHSFPQQVEESAKGADLVSGPRQHNGAAATENHIVLVSGDAPILLLDETCHSPHSVLHLERREGGNGIAIQSVVDVAATSSNSSEVDQQGWQLVSCPKCVLKRDVTDLG